MKNWQNCKLCNNPATFHVQITERFTKATKHYFLCLECFQAMRGSGVVEENEVKTTSLLAEEK